MSENGDPNADEPGEPVEPSFEPSPPEPAREPIEFAPEPPPVAPLLPPPPPPSYEAFGVPDIPLPVPETPPQSHIRDAQKNLDLDLTRIKREKRFGLVSTIFTILFVALVLAPVTWAGIYRFVEAPVTVLMIERAAEGQQVRHTPIPFTQMSPNIVRAVIASEDAHFCTHHGFDVEAIQDAMEANEDGGRVRGGSTISQQTAKNLFLWPARDWVRKGFETYFTSLIEFMWPKRRIIEAYLNAAEWGDGIFGIEAASEARFGVHASELTPLQAARLAAVLPSPNRWRVDSPGPYVRRRAASIVARADVIRNDRLASCALAMDAAPAPHP
ncbi:MAG: monofunctional biosynthetic peptidoglycan transglycosylase [Alphaproteobacteria bacterium]